MTSKSSRTSDRRLYRVSIATEGVVSQLVYASKNIERIVRVSMNRISVGAFGSNPTLQTAVLGIRFQINDENDQVAL